MATLPAQAQAALEEAERIEQGLAAPAPDPDATPPATEPEPAPAPPEPAPAPAPEPAQPPADENWPQKYATLQGMHRADVTRLTGERDAALSQVETLKVELAEARKAPAPTPEPAPATAKLLTDADAEAFGPDMIDLIQRAIAQETGSLKSELAAVKAENATLKGTVDTVAGAQENEGRQKYFSTLATLVPDYATVNTDPAFLAWLDVNEPLSGLKRQTLLNAAFAELDAQRTAVLFKTYKDTLPPSAAPAPAPAPVPKELSSQVQPGSSTGHVPPIEVVTQAWSANEIDQFYKQLARGEYKGRDAEVARIEAEIDRALAAGTVTT